MEQNIALKQAYKKRIVNILSSNSTVSDNLHACYALLHEVGAFGQLGGGPKTWLKMK